MHVHARRDVRKLLQRDVEAIARPVCPGSDERVASSYLGALDAGERDRDALTRVGAVDRAIVHLHAPDADGPPAWLDAQLVAVADRPRPERARHDGADPAQREGAVDVQTRGRL